MKRVWISLAVVVLAVLAVGVAVTHVDAGFLRARIEAASLHATGRRLTIAGPIRLTLWPAPGFVARDVTLDNVPGGSRPAMAHADAVTATLDLGALLGRPVAVRSLVLDAPDILLERGADGQPNWIFHRAAPPAAAGAGAPTGARGERLQLTVSSLELRGGRLAWRDLQVAGSGAFDIGHLTAQQEGAASSFTMHLDARQGATPFSLSVASAPPQALRRADRDHPFALRAALAIGPDGPHADQLALDGTFADPLHARGFAGVVRAQLRELGNLDGLLPRAELPHVAGLRLLARVAQDDGGRWQVRQIDAATDGADAGRLVKGLVLTGATLKATDEASPVVLHAAGSLRGQALLVDAPALGTPAIWRGQGSGAAPLDVAASLGRARASLQGTVARAAAGELTLDAREANDIVDPAALLALFGETIAHRPSVVVEGHFVATLGAGKTGTAALDATKLLLDGITLPPTRIELGRTADGRRASVALGGAKPWFNWVESSGREPPQFTLDLDGHLVPAVLVEAILGEGNGIDGPLDLSGHLAGSVPGGRIDAASLRGPVAATLIDGTIRGGLLAPALHAAHLPFGAGGAERVRCAGFSGAVANGTLTLASLSLDSRLLAIDGGGTVGLAGGTLALHLRPVVRLGVAAASAPVTVGGTLDVPEASLAHDGSGRVALSIGRDAAGAVACDANPDVAARPAAKAPKAADILRSLGGLFR